MEMELQNQKLKPSEVFLLLQAVFVWHHQVNLPTKVSTATKQLHDEGKNELTIFCSAGSLLALDDDESTTKEPQQEAWGDFTSAGPTSTTTNVSAAK